MFSTEKSQIEICLLKSTLDEIENELVLQHSSLPDLDAENDQKFRDTLNAVRISRVLSLDIENLNQENGRLAAKRTHLKMQSEALSKALESALEERSEMEVSLEQEHKDMELHIRKYEDSLREKTERFRNARIYYNEEEMLSQIEKLNNTISELENDFKHQKSAVEEKRRQFEELKSDIPENLFEIV
ncbi:intracellular protein transport protein USO1-like [Hyposmocoma kahamanoa]|uniref:intracellular protein transport protein USO1-like n=1 Tax=Hyposmocoma kahamanoa TaxID=1477025 RepID=UPI000E6D6D57|nr:intracellular protein transport protein USO1-like [Hyposmocoma kahamanoa]